MNKSEFENVDIKKTMSLLKKLKSYRGQIIDSTIALEFFIEVILCHLLFGSFVTKKAKLFRRLVIPQLAFSGKLDILEKIVRLNDPSKKQDTLEFLIKLKKMKFSVFPLYWTS